MYLWLAQGPIFRGNGLSDAIDAHKVFMSMVAAQVALLIELDDEEVILAFVTVH